MNISPYEFEKAEEGSLFVKKGNKLVGVNLNDLILGLGITAESGTLEEVAFTVKTICQSLSKFKRYSKANFMIVFNSFLINSALGNIEVTDEEMLNLDKKVLNDEITVEKALNSHPYLKETFDSLFGKEYENLEKLGGK